MNEEKRLPMGKEFKCHHGFFNLPSEIYEICLGEDYITFYCDDGVYEAKKQNDFSIIKICDL